jgi:Fe-S-cluster formation regulator IscX/YfhJ
MYDSNFSLTKYIESVYGGACPRIKNPNKWGINIEHDVWIGENVTIAPGVTIGTGSVIAARTLVTKSVPPYSIVGGNPGRIIRDRFNSQIVSRLLESQWWTLSPAILRQLDMSSPIAFLDGFDDLPTRSDFVPIVTTYEDLELICKSLE